MGQGDSMNGLHDNIVLGCHLYGQRRWVCGRLRHTVQSSDVPPTLPSASPWPQATMGKVMESQVGMVTGPSPSHRYRS